LVVFIQAPFVSSLNQQLRDVIGRLMQRVLSQFAVYQGCSVWNKDDAGIVVIIWLPRLLPPLRALKSATKYFYKRGATIISTLLAHGKLPTPPTPYALAIHGLHRLALRIRTQHIIDEKW
jgi:hypothetical protein